MDRGLVEHLDKPVMNLCLYVFCASLESNTRMANQTHRHMSLFQMK